MLVHTRGNLSLSLMEVDVAVRQSLATSLAIPIEIGLGPILAGKVTRLGYLRTAPSQNHARQCDDNGGFHLLESRTTLSL